MKKKVKLFSTIASLCLAVALMAFGVWAAKTASVGVTSTIKYTVSGQVQANITIEVKYDTKYVDTNTNTEELTQCSSNPQDGEETGSTKLCRKWERKQSAGENGLNLTGSDILKLGTYKFNGDAVARKTGADSQVTNGTQVVYVITIENLSVNDSLEIEVDDNSTQVDEGSAISRTVTPSQALTGEKCVITKATKAEGSENLTTQKFTYTVTYELVNAAKDVDTKGLTFAAVFKLTAKS